MSAHRLNYRIELLEPVALPSPPGRRSGGGAGLDFIPGSALLGAAARCYADAPDPWAVFHAGAVRFGDARVVVDGVPARPAPFTLWLPKGADADEIERRCAMVGLSAEARRAKAEKGYQAFQRQIGADGKAAAISTDLALRTAIDYQTGRAAQGALFAQHTLSAGLVFGGHIDVDDGVQAQAVCDFLRQGLAGELRLGKRRGAGLGRARLTFRDADWPVWPARDSLGDDGTLAVWLLSETCLLDPVTGAATTEVQPDHFGLDGARVDWARSQVRTVRWTPFNGKRRRSDTERVALKAGSVLVFTGVSEPVAEVRARLARGVGQGRAEGLGQVAVQPALLFDNSGYPEPLASAKSAPQPDASTPPAPPPPLDRLGRWLADQLAKAESFEQVQRVAREQVQSDAFQRLLRGGSQVPRASQWRMVEHVVQRLLDAGDLGWRRQELQERLFGPHGLMRRGTSRHVWRLGKPHSAGTLLHGLFEEHREGDGALWILGLIAKDMAALRQRKEVSVEEVTRG